MTFACRAAALLYVLIALPCGATESTATIEIAGPTVVGFFPPVPEQQSGSPAVQEAVAQLQFALQELAQCLADRNPVVRLEFTRSLTIKNGRRPRRYDFPADPATAIGVLFAAPGMRTQLVYAAAGPASLPWLATNAAARYFSAPRCARQ